MSEVGWSSKLIVGMRSLLLRPARRQAEHSAYPPRTRPRHSSSISGCMLASIRSVLTRSARLDWTIAAKVAQVLWLVRIQIQQKEVRASSRKRSIDDLALGSARPYPVLERPDNQHSLHRAL